MSTGKETEEIDAAMQRLVEEYGSAEAVAKKMLAIAYRGVETGTFIDGTSVSPDAVALINRVRRLLKDREVG
ncbi:hypothetical protein [Paraburkholderia sediminicola]|uniref:hypothetical protein n=1 Tax=Paraburkholderia sediminicola TaxID=458836 RepID=UPI0038BD7224